MILFLAVFIFCCCSISSSRGSSSRRCIIVSSSGSINNINTCMCINIYSNGLVNVNDFVMKTNVRTIASNKIIIISIMIIIMIITIVTRMILNGSAAGKSQHAHIMDALLFFYRDIACISSIPTRASMV